MTRRQRRICKNVLRYKKLNKVLKKSRVSDYIEIQDILGPGNLIFSDDNMNDETTITLDNPFVEDLEQHDWTIFRECFTWILSLIAITISLVALFRS